MRVLLTGGGTLGSVTPLLALAEELKIQEPQVVLAWLGTKDGPEQKLVEDAGITFQAIASGKWRRYFSLLNLVDLVKIVWGLVESWLFIASFKPEVVVAAGSFVSVPVGWVARFKRLPLVIHQQDVVFSLSNRLLAKCATVVTSVWPMSVRQSVARKIIVVGNPVRRQYKANYDKRETLAKLGWSTARRTILIMGGGTGAEFLNELVKNSLKDLTANWQVIHITGAGKRGSLVGTTHYQVFELVTEALPLLMQAADLIISRAGMGTISELSALAKPAIIIPIPNSHQEPNANYLKDQQAAVVLDQNNLTSQVFIDVITELLSNQAQLNALGQQLGSLIPRDAGKRLAQQVAQAAANNL